MEKIISLYAEQIVVSKRTVKVADLVIRKRKVTDTRKVGIDLITEQLTVRNPTGNEFWIYLPIGLRRIESNISKEKRAIPRAGFGCGCLALTDY